MAWAAASNSAMAQTKPHILLIMTDQQRAEHTTLPNTPNVNIQKNECIVFFTSITKARTAKKMEFADFMIVLFGIFRRFE